MNLSALLTSAGINIAICTVLFALYSILRKQPSNESVYFGRRIASRLLKHNDHFSLERFVPSPSWILRAWEMTEEEVQKMGGLDAVVFLRLIVFSIRIFTIATLVCTCLVLPVNYYGQKNTSSRQFPSESLEVFTIANVKEGSKWLWAHCVALYIISCSACALLYSECKSITKMRLEHISSSRLDPSHFTVLVRAIPWSAEESYSDSVQKFFNDYHASSYLSHQMVYESDTMQKLMVDAEKIYEMLKTASAEQFKKLNLMRCSVCGMHTNSFKLIENKMNRDKYCYRTSSAISKRECAAAFVFFRTRYAAVVASQVLQSSNPMLWVTALAPEPRDIYWSNLTIPYRQLWIRKIITRLATLGLILVFLFPVAAVQSLTHQELLHKKFPFLRELLRKKFVSQLVTGYLPSVILVLFLYAVPPIMMLFSTVEGSISRSGRKISACCKVLYFTIWNVFFLNVFTGSIIDQWSVFSSVKDIPAQLAKAVPIQANFFMTYVLSSGWASLSFEVMQPFPLFCNHFGRFFGINSDTLNAPLTFPYHTEIPRVLVFGFIGFTCSISAPLILPFLLFYFLLAFLVYRNQILNVYIFEYESGGRYWPVVHNTTIFSLVFTQVIVLGVFSIRKSVLGSAFTVPLIVGTLLFQEYCRHRFFPVFRKNAAEVLIEMDRHDEQSGRMDELYTQFHSAYCQFTLSPHFSDKSESLSVDHSGEIILPK